MKKQIYLLITILFFSGCGKVTSISSEPTRSSILPSSTASPTLALRQTPTATKSPTLSPTLSPGILTQEALINNYSSVCSDPDKYGIKTSPNKQWITVTCYTTNGYFLVIITADKSKKWELSYQETLGKKIPSAEGYIYVSHWSKDENFVYINAFPQLDGFGFAFAESFVLYRLDLFTGKISEIISPEATRETFFSFGFSPNDRRLAYIASNTRPFSLVIHDFKTGNNQVVAIDSKYNTGGGLVWSDNNKLLAFTAATYNIETDSYTTSVLLWNNEQSKLSTLVDTTDVALIPIKWVSETKIILESLFANNTLSYEFDLETHSLSYLKP